MRDRSGQLLGTVAIVGSVLALVLSVPVLLQGGLLRPPGELFLFLTVALYGYGIWSGLRAVRKHADWPRYMRWFWLAQVPAVSSSLITFFISCGAGAWVYVKTTPHGLGAGASGYLGSGFQWSFQQPHSGVSVGVNVLAGAIAVWLFVGPPRVAPSAPVQDEA